MKPRIVWTILILSLMLQPSVLFAEFAGGTGEPNDPYQIAMAEQLIAIGSDRDLLQKSFILVADIDLDPNLPGGSIFKDALIAQDTDESVNGHRSSSFDGVFDGNGHTISNMHIEGEHGYDAGLFAQLSGLVKDLGLTDVVVSGSPCGAIAGLNLHGTILRCRVTGQVSGAEDVGGFVGSNWDGSLMECDAQVQVNGGSEVGGMVGGGPGGTLLRCKVQGDINGDNIVGGLVGRQSGNSIIECRVTGIVTGSNNVGGLIGDFHETLVWRSSANCEVTAEQTAGGLVGSASVTSGLIADCYARGSLACSTLGGLIGQAGGNRVVNCYAACDFFPLEAEGEEVFVGGLFGDIFTQNRAPLVTGCFWDTELSGIAASIGSHALERGTGLTTEQMSDENIFRDAGWDVEHVWIIQDGKYPELRWEVE
jgi:hypothetical protein